MVAVAEKIKGALERNEQDADFEEMREIQLRQLPVGRTHIF
jgi:hypothetical protein